VIILLSTSLSESSYHPSIPPSLPRSRNLQREKPPTQRQLVKRKDQTVRGEPKRSRIKKSTLKKQKKRVKANISLPSTIDPVITQDPDPIIEAQNAPLSDSPPPQP